MKIMKRYLCLLLLVLLTVSLVGCAVADTPAQSSSDTHADFATAKIGLATGSSHDGTAKTMFPDAQRIYFKSVSDMVLAVEQGKIDCFIEDLPFYTAARWEGAQVQRLEEPVRQVSSGFVFPKSQQGTHLRSQVDTFLEKADAEGTIQTLLDKWMGDTEPAEHPNYQTLPATNGTIRLAVCADGKPLMYKYEHGSTGFEMDLLTLFAKEYGYALEIEEVPFESILAGVVAEKYDMAASALNITPERAESVDFSIPYATYDAVIVVKADQPAAPATQKTLTDFENATLGIHTGSVYDDFAKELFPNAQRSYYNLQADMILATEQRKIDGYITENTYVTAAIWEGANIVALKEPLAQTHAGYVFQKGAASATLREQMDAFLTKLQQEGQLEQLQDKWLGATEPQITLDYDSLTGENGTLRVAASPDLKPVCYIKNDVPTGYEMELLVLFAQEYGYQLDVSYMTFDAILPGVTSGKYDIGSGAVTITEERAQSVDFSKSHLTVDVVMVTAATQNTKDASSFWQELTESFEKTFIREDRWKLILEGIAVTMLISVSAACGGSLLGFGLYMASRAKLSFLKKLSRGIAKVYSRIIAGTPVVVILMILFYVVFGKFRDLSGIVVAIVGFCLTFGAFVYDHLTVSVGSVDPGQTEAAYALGYTRNKAFFRVVFPQAMTVFLPSYCAQAVELVKATAVVGYIAVNDLTKVGDIIRSNTYEAFFPLIATALIYFLLTWLLALLLGLVKRRFAPKRRNSEDILKGVDTQ